MVVARGCDVGILDIRLDDNTINNIKRQWSQLMLSMRILGLGL